MQSQVYTLRKAIKCVDATLARLEHAYYSMADRISMGPDALADCKSRKIKLDT